MIISLNNKITNETIDFNFFNLVEEKRDGETIVIKCRDKNHSNFITLLLLFPKGRMMNICYTYSEEQLCSFSPLPEIPKSNMIYELDNETFNYIMNAVEK